MGHSLSTQSANAPKALLELEIVKASNLANAEWRVGDRVRERASSMVSNLVDLDPSSWVSTAKKPYVKVTVEGQTKKTRWVTSKADDVYEFGEKLHFPLHRPVSTFETLSLKVVVKDHRIWNGLRETPCIGWNTQDITLPSHGDSVAGVAVQLRRERDDIKGILLIHYRILDLDQVVSSPSEHSLADIVKSVAPILMASNGIDILITNMPSALRSAIESTPAKRNAVAKLNKLLSTLNTCAANIKSTSDEEALVDLGELARMILLFIEENCSEQDDTAMIAEEWTSNVLTHCAKQSEPQGPKLNKVRLRKFYDSVQVQTKYLMPVNESFHSVAAPKSLWTSLSVPAVAKLGTGQYGCVWRAKDRSTGKLYAVKSLKVHVAGRLKVAERESQVANLLASNPYPFIVKLFHHFHDPWAQMYFLVMEFCGHGDLKSQVEKGHKRSSESGISYRCPPLANVWIAQIFLGLEYAHRKMDILLRDVKPENVVIADDNVAKLADFGFSRIGAFHQGEFSFLGYDIPAPGSPSYVAPEVALAKPYGPAADLYSFGVLIWVLLTGGLKNSGGVGVPPCTNDWSDTNLEPLASNWQTLKQCIETPEAHKANALPGGKDSPPASLVLALIERGAGHEPPLHDAIRQLEFWKNLDLPSSQSSLDEVQQWVLKSVEQSFKTDVFTESLLE